MKLNANTPAERVPKDLREQRHSTICHFEQGKAHEPFIDVEGEFICATARFISTDGEKARRCTKVLTPAQQGDILMVMSDLPNGRALARAFFVGNRNDITVNQRVARIRVVEGNPRFFFYQLNRNLQLMRYDDGSNQTHLPNRSFTKLNLLIPPQFEQDRIADFLDRETARIDLLIEKKKRLVALSMKKEAAFVENIVTNGFTFQPSRYQDIREDGWTLVKLKNLSSRLKVGVVVNPSQYIDDDGEIPFIYGGNIREYSIDLLNCRRMSSESSLKLKASRLHPGDVVGVRVGAPGVAAVVPNEVEEANCASVMCVTAKDCSGEWLAYSFNTRFVRYQVEVIQYGAAQKQFNLEHAREFTIPVPPRELEAVLVEQMNTYRNQKSKIISKTNISIDRLKEYRSALITAAVTGQIDVQTYAKSGTPDRRLDAIQEEMGG